jgi:2'-5' RNA ligase
MVKEGDHIVVHFVEPQPLGLRFERTRQAWPLHITLAPWFRIADIGKLTVSLFDAASKIPPFEAEVGGEAMFGPNGNVPVNLVVPQTAELELHQAVIGAIYDQSAKFVNDRWIGDAHRPHVTHHNTDRLQEGDVIAIEDFHLVQLLPHNICEVVGQFSLSGRPL